MPAVLFRVTAFGRVSSFGRGGPYKDGPIERHALDIIHRELRVYGLARFLRGYRAGTGDYTRDRHQWLQGLTVQELAKEFEGHQV